mmetsp:Transcript_93774/g.268387  ORF Transcript_93774/g.268387 Transcript_93774/m.268387 type:complete len:84 (-) Transcript_93774:1298-1549(-)
MALSLALSNCGVLPAASPCYRAINQWLVPLSVPLLLFDADLRTVIKRCGALFTALPPTYRSPRRTSRPVRSPRNLLYVRSATH